VEAVEEAEKLDYPIGKARALTAVAFSDYSRAEHRSALVRTQQAIEIIEQEGREDLLADPLGVRALTYWSLGNFDSALDAGIQVMHLHEKYGNREGLAWAYTSAAGMSSDLNDQQQALSYLQKAIAIFNDLGSDFGKARALAGLGVVHRALGQHEAALSVLAESLALFRSSANRPGEARALNDIGAIHQDRGEYDLALEHHYQAMRLREQADTPQALITSLLNIGRVHLRTGRLDDAEPILRRALSMAERLEVKPKVYQAHDELSALFEARGDTTLALAHHKESHRIRDQVFSDETAARMRNLQLTFEMERSRREAEIYRLKNVELARLLDELQAAQAQLVQSGKMAALGDLVAGVAHEMNTPLGVLLSAAQSNESLAQRLLNGSATADLRQRATEAFRENNQSIVSAAARINRIVRSLKGFARLDEAEYQYTDIHQGIEETLVLLEPKYHPRIEIVREYGTDVPKTYCFAAELNQVYRVLLENAIEAIEGSGQIRIASQRQSETIEIRFCDNGRGIPEDSIPRLFNPSFRKTGARVEARMGLFGAYHIIQKHDGQISVDSKPGGGATFTISLPVRETDIR
jgi:signal transduction histidine kinase